VKSNDSGMVVLPNLESDVVVTFKKCIGPGTEVCTSAGAKKGELQVAAMNQTTVNTGEALTAKA
jgi:hypothetical protein